jgi:hypothetical protein
MKKLGIILLLVLAAYLVDRDYFHGRYFRASNSMASQLAAVFIR